MVSQDILDDMTRRLVAEFAPEQVFLFGSQAWGDARDDSDVDLLVVIDANTSAAAQSRFQRGVRARRALNDVPVAKDVLVETRTEFEFRASAKGSLENQIARKGRVLYG